MAESIAPPPTPLTEVGTDPDQDASSTVAVAHCDRCGSPMLERSCKLVCPNCGSRMDCSDLTIYMD